MASDNRSQAQIQTQSFSQSLTQTYAGITIGSRIPRRQQAIVLDSIEGLTIDDYIDGLEELIDGNEIRFLSKIANNRVCVYLASPTIVEQLDNKKIQVKNHSLTIRPYISKNKRVVISNVSPTIPHEDIIQALKIRGITPVSTMSYIRAGTVKPGRSHIMSFRRQIFIKEEDVVHLPVSMQIIDEDIPSWIYFSTDTTNCFLCKQSGHTAKICPKNITNIIPTHDSQTLEPKTVNITQPNDLPTQPTRNTSTSTFKRPPPPSTISDKSANEEIDNHAMEEDKTPMNTDATKPSGSRPQNVKKPKLQHDSSETDDEDKEQQVQLEVALLPIKPVIEDPMNCCVLDYDNFKTYLEKTRGNPNSNEIAQKFTNDKIGLVNMITLVYKHLDDRTLKSRLTKLKKKLLACAQLQFDSDQ